MNYKTKACDGGDGQTCDALATAFEEGTGTKKNLSRAVELRTRACKLGFKIGCGSLGQMYLEGVGVARDERKALALFEEGCTPGDLFDTAPCEWAADILRKRTGSDDRQRANALYEMACKGGRQGACKKSKGLAGPR